VSASLPHEGKNESAWVTFAGAMLKEQIKKRV
jgi:hypothetical protein